MDRTMQKFRLFVQFAFLIVVVLLGDATLIKTRKSYMFRKFLFNDMDPLYAAGTVDQLPALGSKTVSFNLTILSIIPANVTFLKSSILIKKPQGSDYDQLITSKQMLFCKLLEKPKLDMYVRIMINTINAYTSLLQNCPMKQGVYELKNFKLDMALLPSFIPSGSYIIDLQLSERIASSIFKLRARSVLYFDLITI